MVDVDLGVGSDVRARVGHLTLLRHKLAQSVRLATRFGDRFSTTWLRLLITAAVLGVVPIAIAFWAGRPWHQPLTALLLAPVLWSCAQRNDWRRGMALLGLVFLSHSAVAISLAYSFPATAAEAIPDGPDYWGKQWIWITTGTDPEYELAAWIYAHLQLLIGTTLFSFTSLGTVTLHQGLYEVDLMNYYNAQLLHHSRQGWWALLLGWHIWSLLRGAGYVVLTYEMTSFSLQFFSDRQNSTWQHRGLRWAIACTCLAADAISKYALLEVVRIRLFENLA